MEVDHSSEQIAYDNLELTSYASRDDLVEPVQSRSLDRATARTHKEETKVKSQPRL